MKIAIVLNIQVHFCIFFPFLHIEGTYNTRKNTDIINNFLNLPGWKNINDVESIQYRCKQRKLNEVINQTVTIIDCDNFIRLSTIFLGCFYAHDLNILFFVLLNFQKHCCQLFYTGKWYKANNCTVTLLAKINEIVPMAKFMKGALYAIDNHHTIPMNNKKKGRFILRKVLTNLQKNENLNRFLSFSTSLDSIENTILRIEEFLRKRKCELEEDLSFCELKPFDLDLLWNLWNMEFDTLKSQGIYEELYIFLSDKIINLIQTTIWKKFIELGFKFDLNTSQTSLPTPPTNDSQDITQNPINVTQHTNEVDVLEVNHQHDIAQYPSINLIKPNNELDKQDGIKKGDITQNPINMTQHSNEVNLLGEYHQHDIIQNPINETQHTNEVDVLEVNHQHDIAQFPSINLIKPTNELDKQDGIKKGDVLCEEKNDSNLQIEYTDDMIPMYKFF